MRRIRWLVTTAAVAAVGATIAAFLLVPEPSSGLVGAGAAVSVLAAFAVAAVWMLAPVAPPLGSSLVEPLDTPILVSDAEGRIVVANDALRATFGVEAAPGSSFPETLRSIARSTEDPEAFMEMFAPAVRDPGAVVSGEVEQITPERRHHQVSSRALRRSDGLLEGRIDTFTDVTEILRRAGEVEALLERSRRTADSYQRGLLPQSVPTAPRVAMVSHYVSASTDRSVRGDFYDFVPLADGRIGLVIGDVCGHGPAAANDAAMTRYSLRAFARDATDAGRLLAMLNRHVAANVRGERFVRLALCLLDPERAALEYANAGHVPPILFRSRSGKAEWLSEGGIALGVDPDADFKSATLQLDPGDTLVMYTDGVTEASRFGRPFGQGKLSDLVEQYGVGTAGEMLQAIRRAVGAWVPEPGLRDDIALVLCEIVPDETIAQPIRELVVPNESARLVDIRTFVAGFLADIRAPVDRSQEVLIAAGEAAANAARHGIRPDAYSEIRVKCALEGTEVAVTVADEGTGLFEAREFLPAQAPDRFASGGRGLFLMQELMDDVDISNDERGTTVRMSRRMFDAPPAGAPPSPSSDRLDDPGPPPPPLGHT